MADRDARVLEVFGIADKAFAASPPPLARELLRVALFDFSRGPDVPPGLRIRPRPPRPPRQYPLPPLHPNMRSAFPGIEPEDLNALADGEDDHRLNARITRLL